MHSRRSSAASSSAKKSAENTKGQTMNHETPSILLVDDDLDLLHLISMRLTAAGYRVTAVEAADAALASLAVQRPNLVITDLRMQGMDGLGLFDAIHRPRARRP